VVFNLPGQVRWKLTIANTQGLKGILYLVLSFPNRNRSTMIFQIMIGSQENKRIRMVAGKISALGQTCTRAQSVGT
jgi:hypothetical protein